MSHSNLKIDVDISSQFCTCHDSPAVVACAKLWPVLGNWNQNHSKMNLPGFQLWPHKLFVKCVCVAAHHTQLTSKAFNQILKKDSIAVSEILNLFISLRFHHIIWSSWVFFVKFSISQSEKNIVFSNHCGLCLFEPLMDLWYMLASELIHILMNYSWS